MVRATGSHSPRRRVVSVHRKQGRPFVAIVKKKDLVDLTELIEAGKLMPVIEKTYPLAETPEAMSHIMKGHARGTVVIAA